MSFNHKRLCPLYIIVMASTHSTLAWKLIDRYFKDNPSWLVQHHIQSVNDFFEHDIPSILQQRNPITILKKHSEYDNPKNEYNLQCRLYLGGKEGNQIYYGKPVIYDDRGMHYMYPNEARLRNMTYGMSIHYDVFVEYTTILYENDKRNEIKNTLTIPKVFMGRFPIMLKSKYCILSKLSKEVTYQMGECRNDPGGYFVVDGKEKLIVSQEQFSDNMINVSQSSNPTYSYTANIRTVSDDASKPVRTLSLRVVAPIPSRVNGQIVVNIPNVRLPVPLFIVMRALGVLSDKQILEYCVMDLEKNHDMLEFFRSSIHDAGPILLQESALEYIAVLTKGKTVRTVYHILSDFLFPNVGELNFEQKARMLGYVAYRLVRVATGIEPPTDRDSFSFKRVEIPGQLLYDLFVEYYKLQQKHIYQAIDSEFYYNSKTYENDFYSLVTESSLHYFQRRIVEEGIRKGLKGNWGAEAHTKRMGVVQDVNRLSFNSFMSHLRKVNLPIESSAKVVKPHLLHGSQWGLVDPVDTPDGGNVGLHKHLTLVTRITTEGEQRATILRWLQQYGVRVLGECSLTRSTKIFINGVWCGYHTTPPELVGMLRMFRRCGIIPIYTSVFWDIMRQEIHIGTKSGRLVRPVYYVIEYGDSRHVSYEGKHKADMMERIQSGTLAWHEYVVGMDEYKKPEYQGGNLMTNTRFLNVSDVFAMSEKDKQRYEANPVKFLYKRAGIVEYLDAVETEGCVFTYTPEDVAHKKITHVEIHPSLLLGVMGNQVVFPENNQLPRDLFSCGQSKQAVSLYHSNYWNRIDKMGVVLNYGQMPIIKSRYLKYFHKEQHAYGENAMVAIMCYNGYNVEDALIFNRGAIERGLFRTTYYNMYEMSEEVSEVNQQPTKRFCNIEQNKVLGLKSGYDYSKLDAHGLIRENTVMDDKTMVIGACTVSTNTPDGYTDASVKPKKGQLGIVDKAFMTEGEEGHRLAKVRIREERMPAIGDKLCSRAGQKGTVGIVLDEVDMPITAEGIRPDLIVNPHALPSRMTIGQLVECLMAKGCVGKGVYGDCTAFVNEGPKTEALGKLLVSQGYHSTGTDVMYNGMTGEQIEADIFFGPTYYLRLKHMVKDKINYRARGPRTMLERQTVHGRAKDGGLRIGEMERDGIVAHGMEGFLRQSMLDRGDDFYMAVCNKTGGIAVYNESKNMFLSPMADGPLKFVGSLEGDIHVDTLSRFGRDFSVVRVPYTFKLLMHELGTMNVGVRIITDKNVDQLLTLQFSKNVMMDLSKRKLEHTQQGMRTVDDAVAVEVADEGTPNPVTPELVDAVPEEARQRGIVSQPLLQKAPPLSLDTGMAELDMENVYELYNQEDYADVEYDVPSLAEMVDYRDFLTVWKHIAQDVLSEYSSYRILNATGKVGLESIGFAIQEGVTDVVSIEPTKVRHEMTENNKKVYSRIYEDLNEKLLPERDGFLEWYTSENGMNILGGGRWILYMNMSRTPFFMDYQGRRVDVLNAIKFLREDAHFRAIVAHIPVSIEDDTIRAELGDDVEIYTPSTQGPALKYIIYTRVSQGDTPDTPEPSLSHYTPEMDGVDGVDNVDVDAQDITDAFNPATPPELRGEDEPASSSSGSSSSGSSSSSAPESSDSAPAQTQPAQEPNPSPVPDPASSSSSSSSGSSSGSSSSSPETSSSSSSSSAPSSTSTEDTESK